jgi:hypothetical protein
MLKFKNTIQTCLTYAAVVLLAGGYPAVAMAETVDSAPPAETTTETVAGTPSAPEQEKYNTETGHWDSNRWAFNPATNRYEPVVLPLVTEEQTAPETANTIPATTEVDAVYDQPRTTSSVDVDTNATINNTLNSDATTGNAGVKNNTTAGNAATGDASSIATVINAMNSSVSGDGAQFATFVTDVVGDVHGDILLYPMLLKAMLAAATHPPESTIAVNNSATITNDLNLNATSGDASVVNNTNAGNATTGTADTVANVMNIINSIIAANQSFVGTVNIHGNLDGDILVAPDFLPQLLASNNGGSSAPTNSLTVSSEDTQRIINNIDLNAASGNALVANNTNAGNATTGNAKTNLVLLNLSGHQIVAKDSLLVFVNVLGQWVGLIVDAPQGTSAAALGTGVTTNNVAPDLTIDVKNNSQIVNNIALNSQSGDARVAGNTNAGNATSGNATASANVANVSGSQLGLSGWFGVLFINVFGSWLGSFGVDTERGNQPAANGGRGGTAAGPQAAEAGATNQPFQFVPHIDRIARNNVPFLGGNNAGVDTYEAPVAEAQTDTDVKGVVTTTAPSDNGTPGSQSKTGSQFDFLPVAIAAFIIGLGVIATKSILAFLRARGSIA